MRWRAKSWMKEKIREFYGTYIVDDLTVPLEKFLDINKPLWLEIGTGRGRFINNYAIARQDVQFLGVERVEGVIYRAVEFAEMNKICNVRFINRDVSDVFDWLGANTVSRLFLNFSDPWPKKRHIKKRLTHPVMLHKYGKLLAKGAELVFKTDNEGLFDWTLEQFAQTGMIVKSLTRDWHADASREESGDVMTEYELRFVNKGQKIYRVVAEYLDVNNEIMA